MFKKVLIPIILAMVVALPFGSVAYAANTMPGTMRHVGTILWVNQANNVFKFDTEGNVRMTIHVDNATVYRDVSGLAGLQASEFANIELKQLDNGEYVATHIYVYQPVQLVNNVNGLVTSVSASSFTLIGDNGISYVFQVNSQSAFSGYGVAHFRELAAGMPVRVTYRDMGSGILLVQQVTLRHNPINF